LLYVGRRLSATLECPRVGVIVVDGEGRMRHANREALEAHATVRGWWREDGEIATVLPEFITRALRDERPEDAELKLGDATGRSILCTAAPMRHPDGRLSGAVVLVHDVTERKRISRELEARITHLAAADSDLVTG
jgi:NtrC-family two-component system sensor histidine kinase KinB